MRRTKSSIIDAFTELLEERPLNKITVKDIVDRCNINRNTFYYHFPDIPSLLQEMMEEKVNNLIAAHYQFGHPMDCIKPALQYGLAHKQAILHVYRAVNRETFLVYLNRFSQNMVNEYFSNISTTISILSEDEKILNRYYKCIITGCLLDWLDASMNYDLASDIERLCFLLEGSGKQAFQKSAEQSIR